MRGSVHGDVLHSRPAVINYGQPYGTVVFYGANGMSEAPFVFFMAWSVRRLIMWMVDDDVHHLIAAGGIADAAGVRAAMALGAAGVQVGTAYLCSDEAFTSPLHRAALQSEAARHTALTNLFTGRPARGIVNRLMRELGNADAEHFSTGLGAVAPAFPLATNAIGPLRAAAEQAGRTDFTPLWSGQNASGCRTGSATEITQALARGFDKG